MKPINQGKQKKNARAITILVFVGLSAWCWLLLSNPAYNWDMLPYMAIVLDWEGVNSSDLHHTVYEIAEMEIPTENYIELTSGNSFKERMFHAPADFLETTAFYRSKPMYCLLVWGASAIGMPLTMATLAPGGMAFILLGFLFFRVISDHLSVWYACGVTGIIFFLGSVSELARLSSPDGLSALWIFLFFYFITKDKGANAFLLWGSLLLAVLTRLDLLLLAVIALFFVLRKKDIVEMKYDLKRRAGWMLLFGLLSVTAFFVSGLDWTWFQHFTYFESFEQYLGLWVESINEMRKSQILWVVLPLIFLLPLREQSGGDRWLLALLIIAFYLPLRLLIFPAYYDRFFAGFYLVILGYLVVQIGGIKTGLLPLQEKVEGKR